MSYGINDWQNEINMKLELEELKSEEVIIDENDNNEEAKSNEKILEIIEVEEVDDSYAFG